MIIKAFQCGVPASDAPAAIDNLQPGVNMIAGPRGREKQIAHSLLADAVFGRQAFFFDVPRQRRDEVLIESPAGEVLAAGNFHTGAAHQLDAIDQQHLPLLRRWYCLQFRGEELDELHLDRGEHSSNIEFAAAEPCRLCGQPDGDEEFFRRASLYLNRITQGHIARFRPNLDRTGFEILKADGACSLHDTLTSAGRDMLRLSMTLAMADHHRLMGVSLPIILDDPFWNLGSLEARTLLTVLRNHCAADQQIIIFTEAEIHSDRRLALNHAVRQQNNLAFASQSVEQASHCGACPTCNCTCGGAVASVAQEDTQDWDAIRAMNRELDSHASSQRLYHDAVVMDECAQRNGANRQAGRSGASLRVVSEERAVSNERTKSERSRRRTTSRKSERFPGLTHDDEQILSACGIRDAGELARADVDQLHDALKRFFRSDAGRQYRGSRSRYSHSRLRNWRRQYRNRSERSRSERSRTERSRSERSSQRSSHGKSERRSRQRRERSYRETSQRGERENSISEKQRKVRFYLNTADPVVDAPEIGAKMAQRLHTQGIRTVNDLLNADADQLAAKLNNRRVDAARVRRWQRQSELMCRVPGLRGHDAQILIACGVDEPQILAAKDPHQLMGVVGPFSSTAEGARIIRSGPLPDLAEVTDWITWASSSRPLAAA